MTISAKEVRKFLSYNPNTGVFRWRVKLGKKVRPGDRAGTVRTKNGKPMAWIITIYTRKYRAHRLAWLMTTGRWPPATIDHKDGNPLNNRLSNLREASRSQNNSNRRARPGLLKGAFFDHRKGLWKSQVRMDGKQIWLGYFATAKQAHAAYCKAAKVLHGEFHRPS